MQEKFGPGCLFYGLGSSEELDELECKLGAGEKVSAVFAEFPSNPLLKSIDLQRLSRLARTYNFAVIIDDTIGNFANVSLLKYADVIVSSLTKVFNGMGDLMAGRCALI
jgi:cystathionine gamma-synthase